MIDLTEYGFKEIAREDRWIDYGGNGFIVTIFNYFKIVDGSEVTHNTFIVSSTQFTSRSRPISELGDWLKEKNINKI